MALTFPGTPTDLRIIRGYGEVWMYAYTANGADAAGGIYLGHLETKIDRHHSFKKHFITSQQRLNAIGASKTEEEVKLTVTVEELSLARIQRYFDSMANTLTGGADGAATGTLALGGDFSSTEWQVWTREPAPPEAGASKHIIAQYWRCTIESIGNIEIDKAGHQKLQVVFRAMEDETARAAGKGPVYQLLLA